MSMLPRLQNEIFILLPHLPHTYLEEIGPNGAPRRNEIESLCIFWLRLVYPRASLEPLPLLGEILSESPPTQSRHS